MKYGPFNYQRATKRFVIDNKRSALHIGMGMGKTVAVLSAIKKLLDDFACRGVLVFAPLRVATLTWPDEINKWDHLVDLDYVVIRGTAADRLRLLSEQHAVYVVNYDIMQWMCEWIAHCRDDLPFDMMVLDESSKVKSSASKRFKQLKVIASSQLFNRVVEMTGTPMPERYENLWSQYYLLDRGQRLMPFVTHFRSRWMVQNEYNRYERRMRPGAAKEIQDRIADITFTLRGDDWLKLPPFVINDIPIELPPSARRIYDTLEREMVIELNGKEIIAANAAIVGEKCRQAASGALYHVDPLTPTVRTVEHLHSMKMDALQEIVEEMDENLLVAFWYGWEMDEIRKRWPKAPILGRGTKDKDARRIVDKWNAKEIPLLFMHPQSVGHGINLQGGGNNLLFTVLPWSGEAYDQTIHRLHRIGQTKPVVVHRLIATDTADEAVAKTLKGKDFTQSSLLQALASRSKVLVYKS